MDSLPNNAPSDRLLANLEQTAVELARIGGAEIRAALGGLLTIKYKGSEADPQLLKDPVSQVDRQVETIIRARLGERFPDHCIIGEEMVGARGSAQGFVWAVDPIDGTGNFINGFPLFASSVGVLYRGRPIAGALWCSTSHTLHSGVYHARNGDGLYFDAHIVASRFNPAIRRRLGGHPRLAAGDADLPWDVRKTGSAAIECAFVAAGLLRVAHFETPNIWDVAGGLALALASGAEIRTRREGEWVGFDGFTVPEGADLRSWRQPLIIGDHEAVELFCRPKGRPALLERDRI
jgi:myo-inositol-1(or 4)-monophosphatase